MKRLHILLTNMYNFMTMGFEVNFLMNLIKIVYHEEYKVYKI